MNNEKIDAQIRVIKKEIKDAGTPSDMNQLGMYQSWISEKNSEIDALKSKKHAKAKKLSKTKGDKMSKKNENKMVKVEVVEGFVEGKRTLNDIKADSTKIADHIIGEMNSLTDTVKLSEVENDETMDILDSFLVLQKKTAESNTILQYGAKALSKVPYMEGVANSIYNKDKEREFKDGTITESLGNVYSDLERRNLKTQEQVAEYINKRGQLIEAYDATIVLKDETQAILDTMAPSSLERTPTMTFLAILNNRIQNYKEEISDLELLEGLSSAVSIKIIENLPSDKERLFRKMLNTALLSKVKQQNDDLNKLSEASEKVQELFDDNAHSIAKDLLNEGKKQLKLEQSRQGRRDKREKRALEYKKDLSENLVILDKTIALQNNNIKNNQIEYKKEA